METKLNAFGEQVTRWQNHKHPDNPNFMQTVFWAIYEKPDGRVTVCYHLGSGDRPKFIHNLTKAQALDMYGN